MSENRNKNHTWIENQNYVSSLLLGKWSKKEIKKIGFQLVSMYQRVEHIKIEKLK